MLANVQASNIEYDRERVRRELTRLFGHERFAGKQEEVISQVMAGVDTIAVMPTGAGKSLCYQLPAMLLPGVTLVISPLIALMKDQFDSLPGEVYEQTTFINSTLGLDEVMQRMGEILAGKYKLVYCAPERLRQQVFVDALRKARISMLVVDEAHCVSMWGHDFRPDYLFIGKCLPTLGHPLLLALTATATPAIREEIATQLGRELRPVVASVYRHNLYYEVEELADKEGKMRRLIEICKEERGSGVVYARSRETCEQMAAMLRRAGVQAAHYHAGMPSEDRTRTQEMFMLDRVRVIVATIAFGMGIDKSNVRFIIHFSPPGSLESYVQESGRAGRDGRRSRCALFVTQGDRSNLTRWRHQEMLGVEDLRTAYRELARQIPEGKAAFSNIDTLGQGSNGEKPKLDSTQARVSVSMLERAGLIKRHPDAPRSALVYMTQVGAEAQDNDFRRFAEAAGLIVGQNIKRDTAYLAGVMEVSPDELERWLLHWQEREWVKFRGDSRQPVVERVAAPKNAAATIDRLLQQQDEVYQRAIKQIMDYATTTNRCRHRILAHHLGEVISNCEENCDFCAPPAGRPAEKEQHVAELPDNPGDIIVKCLASFPFNAGKPSLINALVGSAASNVQSDRIRHFGALAGAVKASIERAIDSLAEQGYLAYYEHPDGYRLIEITPDGLEGVPIGAVEVKPKKEKRERKETAAPDEITIRPTYERDRRGATMASEDRELTAEERDLFERLKAWRMMTARRAGLPPYVIFHDKTLKAIAQFRPTKPAQFLAIKGISEKTMEKYGDALLEVIGQEEGEP